MTHNSNTPDIAIVHKISSVCTKLDVSRSTIYRMAKAGQLKLIRISKGATRVTDASLRQVLSSRDVAQNPSMGAN